MIGFTSAAALQLVLSVASVAVLVSAQSNFTEFEMTAMKAFDWCTGESIQWIDKSEGAWYAKVKSGARLSPTRNAEGKIADLDAFVKDRLGTIPLEVANEALPTLIIEDDCASVEQPTQDCIFDFGKCFIKATALKLLKSSLSSRIVISYLN